jgi:hypothetical protein
LAVATHTGWSRLTITLMPDPCVTREPLMAWCEANVFGLARNDRLETAIIPEPITATIDSIRTGKTARRSPRRSQKKSAYARSFALLTAATANRLK